MQLMELKMISTSAGWSMWGRIDHRHRTGPTICELPNKLPKALLFNEANHERFELIIVERAKVLINVAR